MRIYWAFCTQRKLTGNKAGGPYSKRIYNLASMPKLTNNNTGKQYKTMKLNAILHIKTVSKYSQMVNDKQIIKD